MIYSRDMEFLLQQWKQNVFTYSVVYQQIIKFFNNSPF